MYVRKVDDQILTFQVSGKLWMQSLIMSDVETKSEWSHLLGRAMVGELQGRTLIPVRTDMVTWGVWRRQHPTTTVLNLSRTVRHYSRKFYRDPSRFVFGFEVEGKPMALGMSWMLKHPVHNFRSGEIPLLATFDREGGVTHLFDRRIEGKTYDFHQVDATTMKDSPSNSRWNIRTGESIEGSMRGHLLEQRIGIMSFRSAWQNYHPESKDVK